MVTIKRMPEKQGDLEIILLKKYGGDHLTKEVCYEGRDAYNPGVKLTLYYTDKPQNEGICYHVGTYNHKTGRAIYFDFSHPESLATPVEVS